jgi:hypothetical protein
MKLSLSIIFASLILVFFAACNNSLSSNNTSISPSNFSNSSTPTISSTSPSPTASSTPYVASVEEQTNTEEYETEESWTDRGYTFLRDKYLKTRMANCGDSYFLLTGKTGLYETKNEPVIEIFQERILPAEQLSEADRLNGKTKALPERWYAQWKLTIEPPYRFYRGNGWDAWTNTNTSKLFTIRFTDDGKWTAYNNQGSHNEFQPIGKFRCIGSNIDVESIQDSPTGK